jgi:ParB-like chromosome segregation protein Spo0J
MYAVQELVSQQKEECAAAPNVAGPSLRLSEVRYVHPSELRANPMNAIFRKESERYFQEIAEDIQKRGIIDALIARPDGMLLSGHNRLRVAERLGLERVPVRYLVDSLNEREEREFLIKDNLLRRHFSSAEKIRLYEHLYENFHERRQKAVEYGKKLSAGIATQPPPDMLTIEQIARDTGQNPAKVKAELYRYYKKQEAAKQTNGAEQTNGSEQTNGAGTQAPDSPSISSTRKNLNGTAKNLNGNGAQPHSRQASASPTEDDVVHDIQDYAAHLSSLLHTYRNNAPFRRKVAILLRELGNRIESNQF